MRRRARTASIVSAGIAGIERLRKSLDMPPRAREMSSRETVGR